MNESPDLTQFYLQMGHSAYITLHSGVLLLTCKPSRNVSLVSQPSTRPVWGTQRPPCVRAELYVAAWLGPLSPGPRLLRPAGLHKDLVNGWPPQAECPRALSPCLELGNLLAIYQARPVYPVPI